MTSFVRTVRAVFARALLAGAFAAGVTTAGAQAITVRDGAGRTVSLAAPAKRVASLIASATDIVVSLGAADRIVARTRYDTARVVSHAVNVGGGMDPSAEVLLAARPDLFIAWNGQASTPVVNRMRALGVPVYLIDTKDTTALYATIRDLGVLLGLQSRATTAAATLRSELATVRRMSFDRVRPTAVYVISESPVIVAATGSYIAQLVGVAGAANPFADVRGEFPTLSLEAFIARDPDILLVGKRADGSRALDRLRAAAGWRDLRAVKRGHVIEVNSEQWGRPTLRVGALVRELAASMRALPAAVNRK